MAKLPYVAYFSTISTQADSDWQFVGRGTTPTNAIAYTEFRLNDINNPQTGLTGEHKPYSSNQWAQRYQKVRVLGCKITGQFWCSSNDGESANAIAFCYSDGSTLGTTPDASSDILLERPRTKILGSLSGFNGGRVVRFSKYFPIAKVFGKKKSVIANDDLYESLTSTSASPNQIARLYVGIISPDVMSFPTTAAIPNALANPIAWFRLTYYVKYTQPIKFSEST